MTTIENGAVETVESGTPTLIQIAIGQATLSEKVTQLMNNHERRITALEQKRDGNAGRMAQILSPIIAGIAIVIAVAGKVTWQ